MHMLVHVLRDVTFLVLKQYTVMSQVIFLIPKQSE